MDYRTEEYRAWNRERMRVQRQLDKIGRGLRLYKGLGKVRDQAGHVLDAWLIVDPEDRHPAGNIEYRADSLEDAADWASDMTWEPPAVTVSWAE